MTNEMKWYEYRITSGSQITYNTPDGYHDDCVIALALANMYRQEYAPTGSMSLLTPFPRTLALAAPRMRSIR